MSAGALVHAGDGAWQAELLPAIAAGEQIVVPAWLEADGGFGPAGVQLRAQPDGDHYLLEGVKRHVFHARAAHRLLVLARTGEGAEAISLFVVDADSPGLHYEQQRSMASDTQYKLTFDKVRVPRSARVGAEHAGWAAWNAAMREGIVLLAA